MVLFLVSTVGIRRYYTRVLARPHFHHAAADLNRRRWSPKLRNGLLLSSKQANQGQVALIPSKAKRRVTRRDQNCYLVRIPEIDDGTQFYIVKKNFKVDQPPLLSLRARHINSPCLLPPPSTLNAGASVMQWPALMCAQEI